MNCYFRSIIHALVRRGFGSVCGREWEALLAGSVSGSRGSDAVREQWPSGSAEFSGRRRRRKREKRTLREREHRNSNSECKGEVSRVPQQEAIHAAATNRTSKGVAISYNAVVYRSWRGIINMLELKMARGSIIILSCLTPNAEIFNLVFLGGSGYNSASAPSYQSDGDFTNTTVFVGGLDPNVSEDELKQIFSKHGDVASVKVPAGKQCGFVQFVQRSNAESALQALNGTLIGKQTARLSWGRNPANKQLRVDSMNRRSGGYYGAQIYGGYGYAVPFQHPGMYAAAYGPYSTYGFQQQVS
ncbi:Polyadenylate-binding protein RBP47 [Dendrobium catenatum]|uniref:Polyadenylate-binding protein RBP47 n=1 Tax=Dendrobium catenatum TaxID=906689 RepID=A0A2I0VSD5_9ASPA|nr:Polyadenylate-binding protein RBP47 [Dendrobium catenatum]